ncbi:MAG: energy transducer TonB [Chthoniobacterales bacterium]|nr:energy transducer TonB [Chthoniobacterales bacterium]
MRSYWIPFLLALGVHLLFFCSFHSFIEKPENGLAKGLSSLEVVLVEAAPEKNNLSSPEIKKTSDGEKMMASHSTTSSFKSAPQKQNSSPHQLAPPSSASSGAIDVTPSYLHNPQPLYPENERRYGHEGTVLLRVAINEQGVITHLAIEHSSGYPSLDDQAASTVERSWIFRPAHRNGKAISSTVLIPIHFSLKN